MNQQLSSEPYMGHATYWST